jgi:hypothetical protein
MDVQRKAQELAEAIANSQEYTRLKAAMGEVHAKNCVPWLESCEKYCLVGLGARVRLYIGMVCAKELFGPVPSQVFCHVHKFAAAVITSTRIAFRILIGELTSHCLQNSQTHKVLRSNQLQVVVLAPGFVFDHLHNLLIGLAQVFKHVVASFVMKLFIVKRSDSMTTELRAVLTMALLRLIAGTIEISAGLLMLKFGRVQTALKINSVLGLIGPIILTLVGTVGLIGLSSQLSWSRLTLTALGVLLIFLGTR